jgi:hypothetical protein
MVRSVAVSVVLGLVLGPAGGCSSDAGKGTVTGQVTLDGAPVKEGLIKFIPADGKSQTADAVITDGQFTAEVPVGEKRVEISAPKVVGQRKMYDTPDSPVVDDVVELLPPRYNTQSELKMTVQAGSQTKQFDLKSK